MFVQGAQTDVRAIRASTVRTKDPSRCSSGRDWGAGPTPPPVPQASCCLHPLPAII